MGILLKYAILLLISILPVIVLLVYVYLKDKNEREPWTLLLGAFMLGSFMAFLVVSLGLVKALLGFDTIPFIDNSAILKSFLEAAIPEECLKFLVLFLLIWKSREFNEHFDGIVYAVFVSMGFACVENILYVVQGGIGVGISRALLAVPAHFLFAVIMGYFFSRARFTPSKRGVLLAMAIICPILAHGVYDTICFATDMYGEKEGVASILGMIFLIFDFLLWKIGLRAIRNHCHICGAKIYSWETNCPNCKQQLTENTQSDLH